MFKYKLNQIERKANKIDDLVTNKHDKVKLCALLKLCT